MSSLLAIRVQKLFLIAVILKVGSSFCGWYFQMQWTLGFAIPLAVMAGYIALGIKRHDRDVTDEKFADSCYYLGFIFTITSIVFSLFDLPSIGDRIQDIAVRFGAAMISTVAGLIVRVYLVSFRPDSSDALKDAEDAVLDAAQKFREQLVMAYEKFGDFQVQVVKATEQSVETVKIQVEKLSQDHSARLEAVFLELNERNQQAVTTALGEVRAASERMSQSVDGYVSGMKSSLDSLGGKVEAFGFAVTERLKTTTFPDDYFASRLTAPLEQLRSASAEVSQQVQASATSAAEAAGVLGTAIRKLKTKATQVEESLDTIVRLTTAQHALFDTSASQLEQLKQVASSLADVQKALQASTAAAVAATTGNYDVRVQISGVVTAVQESHGAMVGALGQLSQVVESDRLAAESLTLQVRESGVATTALGHELRHSSSVLLQLVERLQAETHSRNDLGEVMDTIKNQQQVIAAVLGSLETKADGVSADASSAIGQLRTVAEQLHVLLTTMRSQAVSQPSSVVAGPAPMTTTGLDVPSAALQNSPSGPVVAGLSEGGSRYESQPMPSSSYFPGQTVSPPASGPGGVGQG